MSKCTSSASEEEGHLRDLKRQKLNYGQLKFRISSADQTHPPVSEPGNSETSNSGMEHKSQVTNASSMPLADADDTIVRNVKCAFCQSSKVTEVLILKIIYLLSASLFALYHVMDKW